MSLSDLSADELTRIDAICLQFEAEWKAGKQPSVEHWLDTYGQVNRQVLRAELSAVRSELEAAGAGGAAVLQATADEPATADETATDEVELQPGESVIRPGVQLGPYKVESLIGRGGMGRVYLGLDTRLERPVAIKVLADDWAQRRDRVERFERESRAVAGLRHPNIVSLFDVGTHCGRPYAVMELLDGETLRSRIERGRLDAAETRRVGAQIADALSAAHARGIVHRDLKPENLVLLGVAGSHASSPAGSIVKLLDFGLSRASEAAAATTQDPTASGIVMGTAGYMAPEQARGEKATFAADIFGLGCVLYECFYGRPPFPGKTLAESLGAVLHADPPGVPEIAASDPDLAELIQHCLQKDIDGRPVSASEVAARLRGVAPSTVGPSGNTEHTTEVPWRSLHGVPAGRNNGRFSRRTLGLLAGSAALAGLAGGGWYIAAQGRRPRIESLAVLPMQVEAPENRQPVGDRELSEEEMVAAMLVNQLARQRTLKVVPYRPIQADLSQSTQVGQELGVDALVWVRLAGAGVKRRIHLQLVEVASGAVLWGKEFQYGDNESLLGQRMSAARLAQEISGQVASLADGQETQEAEAFRCLVRGVARLDPDSEAGLRAAIGCFGHAREVDPFFAEAHAGYAITAMSLAALQPPEESQKLVMDARDAMQQALELRPEAATTNLAAAMVMWRDDRKFQLAEQHFQTSLAATPNSWHAHHEYALFLAASGNREESLAASSRAVTLNPLSQTLRVDEVRLRWFLGKVSLADSGMEAMLGESPDSPAVRGLAIDLYEQNGNFADAARLQGFSPTGDAETYFQQRSEHLQQDPYGPFGPAMNRAILDARRQRVDDVYLAKLLADRPTTLVLLMSAHPAFAGFRDRPIVQPVVATRSA
ncbi:serine/threonine-protein kinase [Roseimaritima sediminicola]|uniref:serine/threonine-protein kinase n=1 Tax=Roseimaritima sediminicola TaxID=2662066 RepID=UPI001298576E|nr:serine/threonine-protein kinase [Roseimaritima sediminicola]